MFMKRFRLMDHDGGDPAPGGAPAPAPTPTPAAPADGQPATPAAAAPAAAPASLLQTGSTPPDPSNTDYIPEKLRINKEDGTLDLDGSSRKMAEAYSALEKRFGSGDAPPKEASEYKVAVPDAFKEAIDPATDPGIKSFLDGAHAAGMNQAQVDFVMGQYFTMAPQLVAGAVQLDAAGATTELQKVWGNESEFKRNVTNAYTGAHAAAQKAGINIDEIMNGPLGNNPQFLRMMAAIGPEFVEDKSIGATRMTAESDIAGLMASPAYNDSKHPEHAQTSARVAEYFKRKHGSDPV